MRSTRRAAALVTVLGMPVIAYVLGQITLTLSAGGSLSSLPDADAGVALQDGLTLAASAFGAAIASYLAVTGYAMILGAAWRGGRAIPKALAAASPRGWTNVTATALGLSLSTGLAGPAFASEAASPAASAGWVAAPVAFAADAAPLPSVGWVPAVVTPAGWVQAPVLVTVGADPRPTEGSEAASTAGSTVGWVTETASHPSASPAVPVGSAATAAPMATAAPTAPSAPAAPSAADAGPTASAAYVVQPGDSLWLIAESLLGEGASTTDVAAAWPSLYEANREAIGADPSLIHPGLTLTIPAGLGA